MNEQPLVDMPPPGAVTAPGGGAPNARPKDGRNQATFAAAIGPLSIAVLIIPYLGWLAAPVLGSLAVLSGGVAFHRGSSRPTAALIGSLLGITASVVGISLTMMMFGIGEPGRSTTLLVQPVPPAADATDAANRPTVASLPETSGRAELTVDGDRTEWRLTHCRLEPDAAYGGGVTRGANESRTTSSTRTTLTVAGAMRTEPPGALATPVAVELLVRCD